MLRALIDLIERAYRSPHVWYGCSEQEALAIFRHGVRLTESGYGPAFIAVGSPDAAEGFEVILEFRIDHGCIVDIDARRPKADALYDHAGDVFYILNRRVLGLTRVYDGVVGDPLEETDTRELDEYALGGLARCTAVTVNAILQHFHKAPIRLNDVPVDQPGVIRILVGHDLAYRPYLHEAGRTLQQFIAFHPRGTWCLITKGHAMALIDGELFDAENKGADARRVVAAYQMQRR